MEEAFAGIDWASEEHALCVVDDGGLVLEGGMHAHEEAGLREMIARMRALGVVRVAIERPDGLLVDRLLEAGFTVMPIHPNKSEGHASSLRGFRGQVRRVRCLCSGRACPH